MALDSMLQSARSVWRQSRLLMNNMRYKMLQSARSVWRQRQASLLIDKCTRRCNLHGACGGKGIRLDVKPSATSCNLHGACGGKDIYTEDYGTKWRLQSARSVWRQRNSISMLSQRSPLQSARSVWRQRNRDRCSFRTACVAICTGRAEKPNGIIPRKNPRKFMQTYCIFIHPGV